MCYEVYEYMPCYNPLQAFYVYDSSGERSIKFNTAAAKMFHRDASPLGDDNLMLPCGRCMGCRLERSRQWALRCVHEAKMYDDNCFITLTYDPEKLPKSGSLDKREFQLFMKKLRRKYVSEIPEELSKDEAKAWLLKHGIRYYHCGEYGELLGRPHYHACLFNFDFPDKKFWKEVNGERLFISDSLSDLWGNGFCTVGSFSFESAAYVARYCTKKVNGSMADEHYQGRQPEYATMSRNPGIGRIWYEKFKKDAYPSDFLVINGSKCKPPRYYDNRYEIDCPEALEDIKKRREERSKRQSPDNTYRRLKDREKCQEVRFKKLLRPLEKQNDTEDFCCL